MAKFTCFLRGMNLGKRRITNQELVACFERLGFSDARAFLASGNVVFESNARANALERRIESALEQALGYAVPTFLRTAKQVRSIECSTPFADRESVGRGKLQVVFLRQKPSAEGLKTVERFDSDADWLQVDERQLYWWPAAGISQSELDFKAIEKLVDTTTVRTKMTIERLVKKHF